MEQAQQRSRTAYRVALRRAAHQVFDDPVVFRDPLALRILGIGADRLELNALRAPKRPFSRSLRAFIVARSRMAEDALAQAVHHGCTQYVLLGAGLDTFAYRNPFETVTVYEVDQPATQAWKQAMLHQAGIAVPAACRYVPMNFEHDRLAERLISAGFRRDLPAVYAWLGVVPYLTRQAMEHTLQALASLSATATLVLDYSLPREALPPNEQLALDSLSARVAQAGEPFLQFFTPEEMQGLLSEYGFHTKNDLQASAINARYFTARSDSLKVLGSGARLLCAERRPGSVV